MVNIVEIGEGDTAFLIFPLKVTIYIYMVPMTSILGKMAVLKKEVGLQIYQICLSVINIVQMGEGVSFVFIFFFAICSQN